MDRNIYLSTRAILFLPRFLASSHPPSLPPSFSLSLRPDLGRGLGEISAHDRGQGDSHQERLEERNQDHV
jgi:hypothetical protein